MLSNAYFLAKFRFDTAENEPVKNLQNFSKMHFRKNAFSKKCIFEKCIFEKYIFEKHRSSPTPCMPMPYPGRDRVRCVFARPSSAEALGFPRFLTKFEKRISCRRSRHSPRLSKYNILLLRRFPGVVCALFN